MLACRLHVGLPPRGALAHGCGLDVDVVPGSIQLFESDRILPPDLRAFFPGTSRSLRFDACASNFLSWGFQRSPPSYAMKESTPGGFAFPLTHLRTGAASSDLVPSSWFPTTSTAFSSCIVPVCCARLTTLGFTTFPRGASPLSRGAFLPFRALFPDRSDG